ncbi:molybdate ABC transporter substrate-binding protein [Pseudoruegeria sp. SHC-113]|uniref:molybdate ABC transporter substrate-binding protein n=1 Tax=Pseudoruegeria sp. SHC-113 TaxID=2855439 RepID=UPI0021BB3FE0|nr:molybdate ABC transporter substrate-binding protein [Pseudoruegeria sp. SHC-113]MCT8159561.1 molybdate ABC transporter substrate-binding protein [Pseudoruegeria sp. SHC-113]
MPVLPCQLMRCLAVAVSVALSSLASGAAFAAGELRVFAAASLQEVLQTAADLYEARAGEEVVLVYAGSGALARQIAAGAPADLFISANTAWAEWLVTARPEAKPSGFVAGNALVAIVPNEGSESLRSELSAELFGSRIAMGLTEAVPAGIYGRQALENLGLWEAVGPNVVETENVRVAMALVAAGAVTSGIVYRSDALAEPKVRIAAQFPDASHDQIRYPVVRIGDQAAAFLELLMSAEGQSLFAAHGFAPLAGPGK